MDWKEHVRISLYCLRLEECDRSAHSLVAAALVETEVMLRLNCQWCNGSAWVAWHPMAAQGADPDEFIKYVERLVNERRKTSTPAG